MQLVRPAIASDPRRFGRGRPMAPAAIVTPAAPGGLADDVRLFAVTFLAGFAFVSLFLA